jgi:2-polyprenyl-3-methyl-5-hydroxy-6-metoxy-1,4-benzoquinol methylase
MVVPGYHDLVRSDVFALIPQGGRLLDIGGGIGATALALKQQGLCDAVCLMDLAAPANREGLEQSVAVDLNDIAGLEAHFSQLGPFDTILCLDVLEHLARPDLVLAQAFKALRPGGTLVASIPNVRHWSVLGPLLLKGEWTYAATGVLDRTHLRFFTRRSARSLLANAGLTLHEMRRSGLGTRGYRVVNALTFGLLRDFLTIQYFFQARKPA